MTIGFDDYGSGNFWRGCEADTARLYGLFAHRYNTVVQGCRFYNNSIYGEDNVATGIAFELNTPYATVMANVFTGQDSSHRLAHDMQGASASSLKLFGNQYANVTNHNINHFSSKAGEPNRRPGFIIYQLQQSTEEYR